MNHGKYPFPTLCRAIVNKEIQLITAGLMEYVHIEALGSKHQL